MPNWCTFFLTSQTSSYGTNSLSQTGDAWEAYGGNPGACKAQLAAGKVLGETEETETDAFFVVSVGFIDGFIDGFTMIYPDFDGWRALYTIYMKVLPPKGLFVAALFVTGPVQRYRDRAIGYERVLPLSIVPMHNANKHRKS